MKRSGRQRTTSFLFIMFMIGLIGIVIYLFLGVLGFDSLLGIYGFDRVVETFKVEPPPKL